MYVYEHQFDSFTPWLVIAMVTTVAILCKVSAEAKETTEYWILLPWSLQVSVR